MPLSAGARLGPYEILSAIGAGGMGEVYKARDTRLDRTVAIKVLSAGVASDPDRRRRFEQEARATSALNHPHICVLYDIGSDDPSAGSGQAVDYLVMEHLDGQTLAHRLRKGPMPLDQVLVLGEQISDALAAAHRAGIVHRDLKPANIMLTKSGGARPSSPQAKLLDFGLAKLRPQPSASGAGASALSTQEPATTPGAVMGTVPYMAPEQLEGKETDTRTDLFAFGCVLYEMLTGRRAFHGETEASVISAIMSSEPPRVSTLQPLTPPALERLVARCLAKGPDDRWQHAADVAEELRGISQDSVVPTSAHTPVRARRAWMAGAAAVVLLFGAIAWVGWHTGRPAPVPARANVALPAGTVFPYGSPSMLAFAPDGSGVVYCAKGRTGTRLYWHGADAPDARAIPGTEAANTPFFSPDGRHLGFVQGARLVKLALQSGRVIEGSPTETLADVGWVRGASWGDTGTILYTPAPQGGLWRVSGNGGNAREVTRPDPARNEMSHRWPSFLPGGRAALFTILHPSGRMDRSAIAILSLDSGRWTRIIDGGSYAQYLPTGHIVYARNGALLGVRFDLKTLATSGSPTPVLNSVDMSSLPSGVASFAVSASGALVYAPWIDVPVKHSLVALGRDGQVEPVTPDQRPYSSILDLSSDGQKLAVSIFAEGYTNLWTYHLGDRRWQQLTFADADGSCPVWSPEGDRVAFASNRDGAYNLYAIRGDGEGSTERLTRSPNMQFPNSWSPDGRFLAYEEQDATRGWDSWILPLDGDRKPRLWDAEGKNVTLPAFSPDGRWLAYQSTETGRFEVYVRPFPGPGEKQRVSGRDGGLAPVWSRDGREILYLASGADDHRILAVDVVPGPTLRFANPHVAFALPFPPVEILSYQRRVFAIAPDGRRLFVVRPDPQEEPEIRSLTLIRNWAEEVKAKLAAKR